MPIPAPLRTLLYGTVETTGRLVRIAVDAAGRIVTTIAPGAFINVGVNDAEFDGDHGVSTAQTIRSAANIIDDQNGVSADHGVSDAATPRVAVNIIDDQNGVTGDAGNVDAATLRVAEATDSVLNTAVASVKAAHDAAAPSSGQQMAGYAASGSPADVGEGDLARLVTTLAGFLKIASYSNATDAIKNLVQNWPRYDAPVDVLDETDLGADTYYYPSANGMEMLGYDDASIQLNVSGGVTVTVEADNDDAAGADWPDVTQAFMNLLDNSTNNVSFVDVEAFLLAEGLNVTRIRVKYITADATNGVKISMRRKTH